MQLNHNIKCIEIMDVYKYYLKGYSWTITLNVLKWVSTQKTLRIWNGWTITLNVLKSTVAASANCFIISWTITLNVLKYAKNRLNRSVYALLNHNIKCIEMIEDDFSPWGKKCWTITLNVLKWGWKISCEKERGCWTITLNVLK